MYRTRLKWPLGGDPNFAGRYIIKAWGCGTWCVNAVAMDPNSGRAHWLPGTVCSVDSDLEAPLPEVEPIQFRRASRLLILVGMLNEQGVNGTHIFVFQGGHFRHLLTVPRPAEPAP